MISFDEVFRRAVAKPMDEAISILEGLMELSQHHPALAPEIAILRRLCAAWWEVIPGWETRRLAMFDVELEQVRGTAIEQAVPMLRMMLLAYLRHADLAAELRHLATVCDAWTDLQASDVIVRGRTN